MREEYLPVRRADTGEHEANCDKACAGEDESSTVACIIEWTDKDRYGHEAKDLNGAYPRYSRCSGRCEENGLVVCLECSEAVEQAPARGVSGMIKVRV